MLPSKLQPGKAAPAFSVLDSAGRRHNLAAHRGKNHVVLSFFRGHW